MESIDDVDIGIAAIRSPDFDLAGYPGVRLSMNYFHGQRDAGDDGGGDYLPHRRLLGRRLELGEPPPDRGRRVLPRLAEPHGRSVELSSRSPTRSASGSRSRIGMTNVDIVEGGIDDVYLYSVPSPNQPPGAPTPLARPTEATSSRS